MLARLKLSLAVVAFLAVLSPRALAAQECDNYYGWLSIGPLSSPSVDAFTSGHTVQFSVTNTQYWPEYCIAWFDLSAGSTGNVSIVSGPGSVGLAYNESVNVTVTYDVGAEGAGTITVERSGYGCDQCGTADITILGVHGPMITIPDYHDRMRDVTRCVVDCFDAVASYSTPPYFSNDQPRSVQLLYRSSLARPNVFLNIAAWDTTATYPLKMSVRLHDAAGFPLNFTNGAPEFFFSCPQSGYLACDSTSNRLGVQLANSAFNTGAYTYTLIVRSHRSGGTFVESSRKIRLVVRNESASPFGAGWFVGGYQRLHTYGDSLLITDGNGGIGFFPPVTIPCSPCSYVSPAGDFSKVTTISIDQGAIWRRRYPDGSTVGFNANGFMVWMRDGHGLQTTYGHNGSNQLVAIIDPAGKRDSLFYVSSKLRAIKDPGGRVDSITVNGSGDLTRIKDVLGGLPFQGTYDASHRLIQRTDRRGSVWGMAYDYVSKLKADTAPAIRTNHGANERPVAKFSSLESAMVPDPASGLGSTGSPAPLGDSRTLRAKVTSPRGFTMAFALDRFGQAFRIEAPLGRTVRSTIDTLGRTTLDSTYGGNGHLMRYTWTGPNLTQVKDSLTGRIINYAYDTTRNLLTLRSGDIDSLINVLNGAKTQIDSSRSGGSTVWTRSLYSASPVFHRECTYWGPINLGITNRRSCAYMSTSGFQNTELTLDSLYEPGFPDYTTRAEYQYDAFGRLIRTVDAVKDTIKTVYDSLGRVIRTIGPQRDTTTYTFDNLFLTQVRDARGQIYKTWPNALGWIDSTEDAAGRRTRITYDSGGNPVSVVNRRGQTIQFAYDSLGQVRRRIVGTDTTKYFTDPLGRFTAVANRESVDTLRLDATGRPMVAVSCRVLASGSAAQCFRDSSTYTITNLRNKIMVTAPGLWSTHTASFFYNSAHLLIDSMINFTGQTQLLGYGTELTDSTRTFRAMGNLVMNYGHYKYTPWDRAKAGVFFSAPALTGKVGSAYAYDTLGRVVRHYRGSVTQPDTSRSLVYSAGRLAASADTSHASWSVACYFWHLGERCDGSSTKASVGAASSFSYDSVGNRKDSPGQVYAVDPGNRLRRFGYFRMDYDFDGNLTRKRALNPADTSTVLWTDSLFWSATGDLDSLHRANSSGVQTLRISWGYDGQGRQVRQSGPGATTTRFIWDGSDLIFKLDSLGSRLAYWTFYPGTGLPQSVGFTPGDSTLYYVTDALNNTVALLKDSSATYQVYTQFRYGPFGDSLAVTGSNANLGHLRYKSAFYDGHTRFYRMGVRLYDPDIGRFISEDPLGLSAGVNQYAFAGNDPVNQWDPSGMCPPCVCPPCPGGPVAVAGALGANWFGIALAAAAILESIFDSKPQAPPPPPRRSPEAQQAGIGDSWGAFNTFRLLCHLLGMCDNIGHRFPVGENPLPRSPAPTDRIRLFTPEGPQVPNRPTTRGPTPNRPPTIGPTPPPRVPTIRIPGRGFIPPVRGFGPFIIITPPGGDWCRFLNPKLGCGPIA